MKHFKVFFQGLDKNGVMIYKVIKYELIKWDALKVITEFENKSGLKQVQINSWYEFSKSKRPRLR